MRKIKLIEHYKGCLLGLAAGDALGTTLEFASPGTFDPITDMNGGGPFNLEPGQWTDDTSLALCLAESLIEKRGFDPVDQLERYLKWCTKGYLSSTGVCFDIGNTTFRSLSHFYRTKSPYTYITDPSCTGNGSLMRLAPVPLYYMNKPIEAIEKSGLSSKTTHGAKTCIDACKYIGSLIIGSLNGKSKEEILSPCYSSAEDYFNKHPLCKEIKEISEGSYKHKEPPEIQGRGYVVKSLEAALWAFNKSTNFEDGCLLAVNLGNDADTTGAVYGQLAGAYYGYSSIPRKWRKIIYMRELIEEYAEKLLEHSPK